MQIARLSHDGSPRYAIADQSRYMLLSDDPMFGSLELTGQFVSREDARILAPMLPRSKAVGLVGAFDSSHAEDLAVYLKPNTSVIGPDTPMLLQGEDTEMDVVPQLAAIIGRPCKDITPAAATKVIFGYTLALAAIRSGVGPVRAEAFDASLALGPVIDTEANPAQAEIVMKIAGQESVRFSMADARIAPEVLVAHASSLFSLLPGDVVLLGAPFGNYAVGAPKIVQVEADGFGSLVTPLLAAGEDDED